jgi:hypothetical protein
MEAKPPTGFLIVAQATTKRKQSVAALLPSYVQLVAFSISLNFYTLLKGFQNHCRHVIGTNHFLWLFPL